MASIAGKAKFRTFAFLVYPESAPKDWRETLRRSLGMFAISPLHEPDGEDSKAHYHVMYYHGSPITVACARNFIPEDVPANGFVQPVRNFVAYCRYLCHLDDSDKQQFEGNPRELIECIRGFPLDLTRELTKEEKRVYRREILALIRENSIVEFCDLVDGLESAGLVDYAEFVADSYGYFTRYLDSARNKVRSPEMRKPL